MNTATANTVSFSHEVVRHSAVDHSFCAKFTSATTNNLILIKSDQLEIYAINAEATDPKAFNNGTCPAGSADPAFTVLQDLQQSDPAVAYESNLLTLICSVKLFGIVESYDVIRLPHQNTDSIIFAFRETKISVVHWDVYTHSIATIFLSEYQPDIVLKSHTPPHVKYLHDHNIIVHTVYDKHVIIYAYNSNFNLSLLSPYQTVLSVENNPQKVQDSVVISPFGAVGAKIDDVDNIANCLAFNRILDFSLDTLTEIYKVKGLAYLPGFLAPTILILAERQMTWEGRYAVARHTCSLYLVSLTSTGATVTAAGAGAGTGTGSSSTIGGHMGMHGMNTSSTYTDPTQPLLPQQPAYIPNLIESLHHLPHDCSTMYELPNSTQGVLILSDNAIYHFNGHFIDHVLSTTEFGNYGNLFHDVKMQPIINHIGDKCGISLKKAKMGLIRAFALSAYPPRQNTNNTNNTIVAYDEMSNSYLTPTTTSTNQALFEYYVSLDLGQSALLRVAKQGNTCTMTLVPLAEGVIASTITHINDRFLFIGSAQADSVLLQCTRYITSKTRSGSSDKEGKSGVQGSTDAEEGTSSSTTAAAATNDLDLLFSDTTTTTTTTTSTDATTSTADNIKTEASSTDGTETTTTTTTSTEDDQQLGMLMNAQNAEEAPSAVTTSSSEASTFYNIVIRQRFPSLAPIADSVLTSEEKSTYSKLHVVGGQGLAGKLTSITEELAPCNLHTYDLEDLDDTICGLWAVYSDGSIDHILNGARRDAHTFNVDEEAKALGIQDHDYSVSSRILQALSNVKQEAKRIHRRMDTNNTNNNNNNSTIDYVPMDMLKQDSKYILACNALQSILETYNYTNNINLSHTLASQDSTLVSRSHAYIFATTSTRTFIYSVQDAEVVDLDRNIQKLRHIDESKEAALRTRDFAQVLQLHRLSRVGTINEINNKTVCDVHVPTLYAGNILAPFLGQLQVTPLGFTVYDGLTNIITEFNLEKWLAGFDTSSKHTTSSTTGSSGSGSGSGSGNSAHHYNNPNHPHNNHNNHHHHNHRHHHHHKSVQCCITNVHVSDKYIVLLTSEQQLLLITFISNPTFPNWYTVDDLTHLQVNHVLFPPCPITGVHIKSIDLCTTFPQLLSFLQMTPKEAEKYIAKRKNLEFANPHNTLGRRKVEYGSTMKNGSTSASSSFLSDSNTKSDTNMLHVIHDDLNTLLFGADTHAIDAEEEDMHFKRAVSLSQTLPHLHIPLLFIARTERIEIVNILTKEIIYISNNPGCSIGILSNYINDIQTYDPSASFINGKLTTTKFTSPVITPEPRAAYVSNLAVTQLEKQGLLYLFAQTDNGDVYNYSIFETLTHNICQYFIDYCTNAADNNSASNANALDNTVTDSIAITDSSITKNTHNNNTQSMLQIILQKVQLEVDYTNILHRCALLSKILLPIAPLRCRILPLQLPVRASLVQKQTFDSVLSNLYNRLVYLSRKFIDHLNYTSVNASGIQGEIAPKRKRRKFELLLVNSRGSGGSHHDHDRRHGGPSSSSAAENNMFTEDNEIEYIAKLKHYAQLSGLTSISLENFIVDIDIEKYRQRLPVWTKYTATLSINLYSIAQHRLYSKNALSPSLLPLLNPFSDTYGLGLTGLLVNMNHSIVLITSNFGYPEPYVLNVNNTSNTNNLDINNNHQNSQYAAHNNNNNSTTAKPIHSLIFTLPTSKTTIMLHSNIDMQVAVSEIPPILPKAYTSKVGSYTHNQLQSHTLPYHRLAHTIATSRYRHAHQRVLKRSVKDIIKSLPFILRVPTHEVRKTLQNTQGIVGTDHNSNNSNNSSGSSNGNTSNLKIEPTLDASDPLAEVFGFTVDSNDDNSTNSTKDTKDDSSNKTSSTSTSSSHDADDQMKDEFDAIFGITEDDDTSSSNTNKTLEEDSSSMVKSETTTSEDTTSTTNNMVKMESQGASSTTTTSTDSTVLDMQTSSIVDRLHLAFATYALGYAYQHSEGTVVSHVLPTPLPESEYETTMLANGAIARSKYLQKTAKFVRYHEPTDTFVVITCQHEDTLSQDDITDLSVTLWAHKHRIEFYSRSLELLYTYEDIEIDEAVTSLHILTLHEKSYVAVGLSTHSGPDVASKGRVILLQPFYQSGIDHKGVETLFLKFTTLIHREKFPVLSLESFPDMLIVGAGSRVFLYELNPYRNVLVGRAFYPCQLACISLKTIKNIIVVADVLNSVILLVWDANLREITMLGRHYAKLEPSAINLYISGDTTNVLVADNQGNTQLLQYLSNKLSSRKYNRLSCRAEYYVGSPCTTINLMLAVPLNIMIDKLKASLCAVLSNFPGALHALPNGFDPHSKNLCEAIHRTLYSPAALTKSIITNTLEDPKRFPLRTIAVCGLKSGGITTMLPIDQLPHFLSVSNVFKELSRLLPQVASLEPNVYRGIQQRGGMNIDTALSTRAEIGKCDVVDIDYTMLLALLPMSKQLDIAKEAGTVSATVIDTILNALLCMRTTK